jgi:hypothetical protein
MPPNANNQPNPQLSSSAMPPNANNQPNPQLSSSAMPPCLAPIPADITPNQDPRYNTHRDTVINQLPPVLTPALGQQLINDITFLKTIIKP